MAEEFCIEMEGHHPDAIFQGSMQGGSQVSSTVMAHDINCWAAKQPALCATHSFNWQHIWILFGLGLWHASSSCDMPLAYSATWLGLLAPVAV